MVYLWTLLAVLFFGLFGWQVTRADPQPHFIAINAVMTAMYLVMAYRAHKACLQKAGGEQ